MKTEEYSLEWLLPYVRKAMRGTGNFDYRTYADAVLSKLHDAGVPGVSKNTIFHASTSTQFNEREIPHDLKQLITEAHFYLFRHGYIAPAAGDTYINHPAWHRYNVTRRGQEYLEGHEPLPEEAKSYLAFLRERVPNLDLVIEQYIIEALTAFDREAYFAASVMVGAASEKAIYLLAASLLNAMKPSRGRSTLETAMNKRQLFALLESIRKTVEACSSGSAAPIPYSASEGSSAHLGSLFEAIRTQRNDAVHPMNATVSASSVRLLLHSFPYALSATERLRSWCYSNPGTL